MDSTTRTTTWTVSRKAKIASRRNLLRGQKVAARIARQDDAARLRWRRLASNG